MKLCNPLRLTFTAACFAVAFCAHAACERFVWSDGHGDLAVNYLDGQWRWNAEEGKEVEDVIIRLNDVARLRIPDQPDFAFLGAPGDPIWVIPAGQKVGIPFLGISAEATPSGAFVNGRFDLLLSSVRGTGDFIMWTTSGTGVPTIHWNSRDGIGPADKTDVPAGGHFHQNWGFTAPGTYRVGFRASGRLSGQSTPITSGEAIYTFEVNVLKAGEADIEVALQDGALEFHVREETTDTEFDPAHVALQAGPKTWQTVPASAAFAFLGQPGASLYVLPQVETEGVLFLGLAAGEVGQGLFARDELSVRLAGVEGPGKVFYYAVDGFGAPTVFFNSADGLGAADAVTVAAGSHAHRNLAFSGPGVYRVTLQASGTLLTGADILSEPATFLIEVLPPTFIEQGEIDLEIAFEGGAVGLALREDATGQKRCADETVLVARAASRGTVPEDPRFSFLGAPGRTVFILPQQETQGVLFLGLAADEVPAGVFVGDSVNLQLVSLDGPGQLALYATDSFGAPTVHWNSRDGLDGNDVFRAAAGSHTHANWAFDAPGVYRVGLRASGKLVGSDLPTESEIVTFTFLVQETAAPGGDLRLKARLVEAGAQLEIAWASRAGVSYQLQSRTALGSGDWSDEGAPVHGDGGPRVVRVARGTETLKLFRLLEVQP